MHQAALISESDSLVARTSSYPLVSIVTPCLNQARFLEETILSVKRQDYPFIEHIIIDGGSNDGSVDIIKAYTKALADWVSEQDNGQSSAINKGFSVAHGNIFAWLNSDDLLAVSAVRIAIDYLGRYPEVGVIYGDRLHIDQKGNVIGVNQMPCYYPKIFKRNKTLPQETVFFRREVWQQVGGLDESLHYSMDFDLWCRMAKITRFRHIPAFLGFFREHSNAKSVFVHDQMNENSGEFFKEHQRVYRKHFGTSLPGPLAARCYRVIHKANLAKEFVGKQRAAEVRRIRSLITQ